MKFNWYQAYLVVACICFIDVKSAFSENLPTEWQQADYLLLGEVHDNQQGHELRFGWIEQLVKDQSHAIAMEQLDKDKQSQLDTAIQEAQINKKVMDDSMLKGVAASGGFAFKGWNWAFYAPVFNLAIGHHVPLIATNLSQQQLMHFMMSYNTSLGLPVEWSKDMTEEMQKRVEKGHCDLLPEDMIGPMAEAQIKRDQTMALSLVQAHKLNGLPVILIAGNGHLRNDLAVPFWIRQFDPGAKIISVAVLEKGNEDNEPESVFNQVYYVNPVSRPDPCLELKKHKFNLNKK